MVKSSLSIDIIFFIVCIYTDNTAIGYDNTAIGYENVRHEDLDEEGSASVPLNSLCKLKVYSFSDINHFTGNSTNYFL